MKIVAERVHMENEGPKHTVSFQTRTIQSQSIRLSSLTTAKQQLSHQKVREVHTPATCLLFILASIGISIINSQQPGGV